MNMAAFIFNLAAFLLPLGLLLERFGVCLKQEIIMLNYDLRVKWNLPVGCHDKVT